MRLWKTGLMAVVGLAVWTGTAKGDVFNLPAGETSLQFVTVGDPGNSPDPLTGFGSVAYQYKIGTYDVSASQYCDMLNAVASVQDTYQLFNKGMSNGGNVGILQSGTAGSYTYSVESGHENFPVDDITWGDAARFCNWLANGQPTTGVENSSTTESGSYQLDGAMTDQALAAVTRSPNAIYVIPTENEWYKAAYLDSSNGSYFLYPTQSDTPPSNVLDPNGTDNANFRDPVTGLTDPVNFLTSVGAFSSSPGPWGTFDQGGDVYQWTDTVVNGTQRVFRGGSFASGVSGMQSGTRPDSGSSYSSDDLGFRIAEVPEPDSIVVLALGSGLLLRRRPK